MSLVSQGNHLQLWWRDLARGTKKKLLHCSGRAGATSPEFQEQHHPDGALPNPRASLLCLRPRWARPSQLPSLWSSCRGAPFSLKRQPEECGVRVRGRKWGFQSCCSPGDNIPLCLHCFVFLFIFEAQHNKPLAAVWSHENFYFTQTFYNRVGRKVQALLIRRRAGLHGKLL